MTRPQYLTKSRFKLALECPTKLFYTNKAQEYANNMAGDEFMEALADGGYQVGELAKYYYPGGILVEGLGHAETLEKTTELLEQENVVIFEAAIKYKDCFIRIDILEKKGNQLNLIEVKAKSYDTSKTAFLQKREPYISSGWLPYIQDVAFQKWVLDRAYPECHTTPYLFLVDKTKKASVNDLNQLFRVDRNPDNPKYKIVIPAKDNISREDLGDELLRLVPMAEYVNKIFEGTDKHLNKKSKEELKSFEARILEYADLYKTNSRFPTDVGRKCGSCEFKNDNEPELKNGFAECWNNLTYDDFDPQEPTVLDIWFKPNLEEMINDGVVYLKDVNANKYLKVPNLAGDLEWKGTRAPRQALQISKRQETEPKEDVIPDLFDHMESWQFPLHFIDFETSMVALPFYKGRKPYEQVSFQFSSHTLHEDGRMEHTEYINAEKGKFPNFEMAEKLKAVLDKDQGTIFRYAMHENTVMRQIQGQMEDDPDYDNPDLVEWIDVITEKKTLGHVGARSMVDLQQMVAKYYYSPFMGGSNSLKYVLPAIIKESPFLKDKYSRPLSFGTHLKDLTLFQEKDGEIQDPYKILPPFTIEGDKPNDKLFTDDKTIANGGQAMVAYGSLQYKDMPDLERAKIQKLLLQYCELDTLAMVMIYEHFLYLKN